MKPNSQQDNVEVFGRDVLEHGGYLYSTQASLSSRLAHQRISTAVFATVNFQGAAVIDIGCGDGAYTQEIITRGRPARLHGIDLVPEAVELARQKMAAPGVTFGVDSAYELPFPDQSFDIAHLRAVLHHMDEPERAIGEALRVAKTIVVAEPNGNNFGVKLFERFSAYHRAHHEKSYSSFQLNRWVVASGGVVEQPSFIGLVPTFCPDWAARVAKFLEPALEHTPILRTFGCSIYVFRATKATS
jgi:ubiquinone/menaquinone biosynthesis C-methylase UbiE